VSPALDSLGLWEATLALPEQVDVAAHVKIDPAGLPRALREGGVHHVVALGLGDSGAAGEVLAAVAGPRLRVPLAVVAGGELPGWVGPGTLVIATSYSGDTEDVVTAAEAAWARGAGVVAVTSGGRLLERAVAHGAPVAPVPVAATGRGALGVLAVPALLLLEQMELFDGATALVDAAVRQLRVRRDQLAQPSNAAVDAADRIDRTFPLLHGTPGPAAVAAHRWKTQINLNAKAPAFWSVHPELCHNELAGWGQHGDVTRQLITLVTLRCPGEPDRLARRVDLVTDILREVVADVVEVQAAGQGPLAHLFDLALIGDVVSLCMATSAGVDPGPIPMITALEAQLRS
jgi:glucose/mannose-6-phosphate isomerase